MVVWSKQAEICQQYLKKGRSVFVEGRLLYRSWETDGKTRSTMEVRADRVQFLSAPTASREPVSASYPGMTGQASSSAQASPGRVRGESERGALPEDVELEDPEVVPDANAETDVPF